MYSTKWPDAAPIAGGADMVFSAVSDVGERSFYAMVEPCDAERFAELADTHADWLAADVAFSDAGGEGHVVCRLPDALARRLFDAFSGRDTDEPPPAEGEVHDLVGEFANMICGSWLTRAAHHRTFSLAHPRVTVDSLGHARLGGVVPLLIDEHPCLVEVSFTAVPEAAVAH